MRTRIGCRIRVLCAVGFATGSINCAAVSPALAQGSPPPPPAPNAKACDSGYQYNVITDHGRILDGKGQPTILQNNASTTATLELSQTESGTVEWSVNGSVTGTGSYDFAVISGSVAATVGGSYTSSEATDQTVRVSLPVPSREYGIIQGGAFRQSTYGHYYYLYGNCATGDSKYITTKVVYRAQGFADTTNSTGSVPWDQQ